MHGHPPDNRQPKINNMQTNSQKLYKQPFLQSDYDDRERGGSGGGGGMPGKQCDAVTDANIVGTSGINVQKTKPYS